MKNNFQENPSNIKEDSLYFKGDFKKEHPSSSNFVCENQLCSIRDQVVEGKKQLFEPEEGRMYQNMPK